MSVRATSVSLNEFVHPLSLLRSSEIVGESGHVISTSWSEDHNSRTFTESVGYKHCTGIYTSSLRDKSYT